MLTFIKKNWFILLYLALYFIAINAVVLNRFWQFEGLYFDHGIFDSSLWQIAHFKIPIIDHLELGYISQFSDHFTPTMYLLSPIYWLTTAYEPILILGNFFIIASVFVIFTIANQRIKNRLAVFAIIFSYTLFIGLQNTIIANFHTELIALFTLSLTFLAIEKRKWHWYLFFLVLTFGAKETFTTIGVGIGIYVFFINRRVGITTILLSLFYYFLVTRYIIPHYAYEQIAWDNLFLPKIKTETMIASFATFGFLPLGALTFLPTIFQDFLVRFVLTTGSAHWDLGMHYNATLSILLTYGTILTASRLNKKILTIFAIFMIATTLFFHRFKYHGPLGLAFNPAFYSHTSNFNFLHNLLARIPKNKKVMTLNNLATYMTHTNEISLLRSDYQNYNVDLIVLDLRPGQNPVNFWPANEQITKSIYQNLKIDKNFEIIYSQGDQIIFRKK